MTPIERAEKESEELTNAIQALRKELSGSRRGEHNHHLVHTAEHRAKTLLISINKNI